MSERKKLVGYQELADLTGYSAGSLRHKVRFGEVPCFRGGRKGSRVMFDADEVVEHFKRNARGDSSGDEE